MPRKPRRTRRNAMEVLAEISLQERNDKIEENQRRARSREVALEQHRKTEKEKEIKLAKLQRICDHLLGNHRMGVVPERKRCGLHKDYLSDGSVRIYCGKCRFEWRPGDKAEFILRVDGQGRMRKLPNPTAKSWRDINKFFYTFENATDLTSRAFRIVRVEPEDDEADIDFDERAAGVA